MFNIYGKTWKTVLYIVLQFVLEHYSSLQEFDVLHNVLHVHVEVYFEFLLSGHGY